MAALNLSASRELARSFGGVFGSLFRARSAAPVDQHAEALRAAKAKRASAMAEYRDAKERSDTRGCHDALRTLRRATTDLVRLELGQ